MYGGATKLKSINKIFHATSNILSIKPISIKIGYTAKIGLMNRFVTPGFYSCIYLRIELK